MERLTYQEMLKSVPKEPIEKYREFVHEAEELFREWWGSDKKLECSVDDGVIQMKFGKKKVIYERKEGP